MIRHASLRKVVSANPFAPVPAPDLTLPVSSQPGILLLINCIKYTGLQYFHCLGAVLYLTPLLLASHHGPGRQMGNPDRRVGCIDMLPSGAGRAIDVNLQ